MSDMKMVNAHRNAGHDRMLGGQKSHLSVIV